MGEQCQRTESIYRGPSFMHCCSPPDLPRRTVMLATMPRRHDKTSGDKQQSEAYSSPPEQQLPCALLSFVRECG